MREKYLNFIVVLRDAQFPHKLVNSSKVELIGLGNARRFLIRPWSLPGEGEAMMSSQPIEIYSETQLHYSNE